MAKQKINKRVLKKDEKLMTNVFTFLLIKKKSEVRKFDDILNNPFTYEQLIWGFGGIPAFRRLHVKESDGFCYVYINWGEPYVIYTDALRSFFDSILNDLYPAESDDLQH